MSAAIDGEPEAVTTGGPRGMGGNAAGESLGPGFLTDCQAGQWMPATGETMAQRRAQRHGDVFRGLVRLRKPGVLQVGR